MTRHPPADRDMILRAFDLFVAPGDVIELRAPVRRGRTRAGYFDDRERFATAAVALSGQVAGCYWTVNPVQPALLGRYCNRLEDFAATLTPDGDILCRRRIPFDLDPTRPAGISSTADEHARALAAADRTRAFLIDHGVPPDSLVDVDSGNGGHVHLAVDLPNDDAATTLVRTLLAVVAAHIDDEAVHVDQTMFNASRIVKIPGTLAAKGDALPDRPHRLAIFRTIPPRWMPVDTAVLHALAALQPTNGAGRAHPTGGAGTGRSFDVRAFLATHGVTITREKPWQGTQGCGTFLELATCLFDVTHDRGEAGVILLDSGMLLYTCRHDSCRTKHWSDVRRLLDPDRASGRAARDTSYEQYRDQREDPDPHGTGREPGSDDGDEDAGTGAGWSPAPATDTDARRFGFITLDDLKQRAPQGWRIHGLLVQHAVACIYGAPGEGKTFVALDMGCAIASGRPWCGGTVHQTRVMVAAAEGVSGLKYRIQAWEQYHGVALADAALVFYPRPLNLLDHETVCEFITVAAAPSFAFGMLVIDTLAPCINIGGGNENDSKDMGRAMANAWKIAEAVRADVLVIHHCGRQGEHARGSNSLDGACQTMIRVEQNGDLVTVATTKQRDDERLSPLAFKRTIVDLGIEPETGEMRTSCVLVPATPILKPVLDPNERLALDKLATFPPTGAVNAQWHRTTAQTDGTFRRVRDRLLVGGYVEFTTTGTRQGGRYVLTKKGVDALKNSAK